MDEVDLKIRRGLFRRGASSAANEIVYAIGDVHGRFDLFSRLIQQIEADSAVHRKPGAQVRIIVLGDFIDRGPDSRRMIELLRALHASNTPIEVLLGNHEAMLLESVAGDAQAQQGWLRHGGLEALESFGIDPPASDEDPFTFAGRLANGVGLETIDWLRDLPLSARSGDYFFCHAGVRPGTALDDQAPDDLLWVRDDFMSSQRNHGAVIVHGHNIVDSAQVRTNRISLDTGAYRTERLSAVRLGGTSVRIIST